MQNEWWYVPDPDPDFQPKGGPAAATRADSLPSHGRPPYLPIFPPTRGPRVSPSWPADFFKYGSGFEGFKHTGK